MPMCPADDDAVEQQRDFRRQAVTDQVVSYICESGDGEFAMLLWDALELLPEVVRHFEHLASACDVIDRIRTKQLVERLGIGVRVG